MQKVKITKRRFNNNIFQARNNKRKLYFIYVIIFIKVNKVQIAFSINHIDENTIPTLCFYGGKDIDVGIGQYSYLKRAFEEKNNKNIVLVYSKYSSHEEVDTKSEEGKASIQKYNDQLSYFENTYFTKD